MKTYLGVENKMAVSMTARLGVGVDIVVASLFAGVLGESEIAHYEKIILRPYLNSYPTPDSPSNPYYGSSRSVAVMMDAMIPLDLGIYGATIDNLGFAANAHLYSNGCKTAYQDINVPSDYNDDRIMADGNPIDNSIAYGFDLNSSGNNAMAAWETLSETVSEDALIRFTLRQILAGYTEKMEIKVASYNGS